MMADREVIDIIHLPDEVRTVSSASRMLVGEEVNQFVTDASWTLEELERRYIEFILQSESGNVPKAAARLGVPRSTLYSRLKSIKRSD